MRHLACFLIFLATAAPAAAQPASKVAIGGFIGSRMAPSATAGGRPVSGGLLWRFGHSKEGFGWEWGLNWFSSNIDRSLGGTSVFQLGELHVRPLMVGYGYTHLIGPTSIKGSVQGGYAFASFDALPSAADEYRDRLGARSFSTDAANTFVVKPQVSVWHDLNRKFGLNITAGYMIARPRLTVTTTLGEERQRVRADMIMLKAGVVYSIF